MSPPDSGSGPSVRSQLLMIATQIRAKEKDRESAVVKLTTAIKRSRLFRDYAYHALACDALRDVGLDSRQEPSSSRRASAAHLFSKDHGKEQQNPFQTAEIKFGEWIWEFECFGGTRLKDACIRDVRNSYTHWEALETQNGKRKRFMAAILKVAKNARDDDRVPDVLTLDQLLQCYKQSTC